MYLWSAAKQGYFWKQLDVYFKCFEKVLCSWTISFWVLSMFWEWWNKYVSKEYKEFWHALIPALAWVLIPSAESSVLSLKLCVPCVTLIETQGHQSAPVWELLLRFLVNYCLTANSYITVQKKSLKAKMRHLSDSMKYFVVKAHFSRISSARTWTLLAVGCAVPAFGPAALAQPSVTEFLSCI